MVVSMNWGSFLWGVLLVRALLFWGLQMGPLILGNSLIRPSTSLPPPAPNPLEPFRALQALEDHLEEPREAQELNPPSWKREAGPAGPLESQVLGDALRRRAGVNISTMSNISLNIPEIAAQSRLLNLVSDIVPTPYIATRNGTHPTRDSATLLYSSYVCIYIYMSR